MMTKLLLRSFIFFFALLGPLGLLPSVLANTEIVFSSGESAGIHQLQTVTSEDGQWVEMGSGSATGGGISNNGGSSYRASLAIDRNGTPIVAWLDDSNGNDEIYVRRWDGTSWVEMGNGSASGGGISNNSGGSWYPSLAISPDSTPIVAWMDGSNGNFEIYVRRWNGISWVEMGNGSASGGGISNNGEDSWEPSLAISPDGTPMIAWTDYSGDDSEIYLRIWNGTDWAELGSGSASAGGISNDDGGSGSPFLAISPDGKPIIAWVNFSSDDEEIYVRGWDGTVWVEMGTDSASGGGISNNSGDSESPSLAISPNGTPIIAWDDKSSGKEEIYVRRWDGTAWVEMGTGSASVGGISNNIEGSYNPSLAIDPDGLKVIAWHDWSNSPPYPNENSEIYVRYWNDTEWVEMGSGSATGGGISDDKGSGYYPSLSISPDGIPVVAWGNWADDNPEIYVRRWQADVTYSRLFLPSVLAKE
jgi:hypothetical protein